MLAWSTMLNRLTDIANDVDDLENITEVERTPLPGGIRVVNVWKAKPKLPAMVMKYIHADMLAWTDTATWKEKEKIIDWEIRSHHFHEEMHCRGWFLRPQ